MKVPAITAVLLCASFFSFGQSDFYKKHWNRVYRNELNALPKSALQIVDTIYSVARKENNIPQIVRALVYQSKFAVGLQENAELIIIDKFQKEISGTQSPLKNILESLLANIYWQYLQENRWKLYSRSRTSAKVDSTDFRTWDADLMYREIHRHYQNSLKLAPADRNINLAVFNEILIQGEDSRLYRPTLFDFLAHEAIDFYETNESYGYEPDHSILTNNAELFQRFDQFSFVTIDTLNKPQQALMLYQELLRFHQSRYDTSAFVHAQIERLSFLKETATRDDKETLFLQAIENLRHTFRSHRVSALLDFELAQDLFTKGQRYHPVRTPQHQFSKRSALDICHEVITRFPKSDGAEKCLQLKATIEAQSLHMMIEQNISVQRHAPMFIEYTNVDKIHFRAFKVERSFSEVFHARMGDSLQLATIHAMNADTTWTVQVKNLSDYQKHSTEVIMPKFSAGCYLIFAEVPAIDGDDPIFAYAFIQVTDLALLAGTFGSTLRFQVVDRNNGKPIKNATVHLESYSYSDVKVDDHFTTDANGFFEFKTKKYGQFKATVTFGNDVACFEHFYGGSGYDNGPRDTEETAATFMFTDRSIYRPGQTVYFKGILIKTRDQKSSVVAGQYVEVIMEDANNEEVDAIRLKTNAYGSFSGTFTLPASGLTGEYKIYADEDVEGDSRFYDDLTDFNYHDASFSVEEYKRPTFEVTFTPVKASYKLNDTITVKGFSKAYSGASIANAKVKYYVKRVTRYPHWYHWYYNNYHENDTEITSGETTTDASGNLDLRFRALPDETVDKEGFPVFHYEIKADVTDVNGETRSAVTTVKVGYHSLIARISVAPVMDRKKAGQQLNVSTENLNEQPVFSVGEIRIHKLQGPQSPVRERPWSKPDLPSLTKAEFKTFLPNDPYDEDPDPKKWEKGKVVFENKFDTKVTGDVLLRIAEWDLGYYLVEMTTNDSSGQLVKERQIFRLMESGNNAVADQEIFIFQTDKPSYRVGEVAKITIGSAAKDITFTIDIEKDFRIQKTYVEHLSGTVKEISVPITATRENGFAIHCTAVAYNSVMTREKTIPVLAPKDEIEIETLTFKDKLQPGEKETWSFQIKSGDPEKNQSELLASMYDASLDQFKPHEWKFNPIETRHYYSYFRTDGQRSFGTETFNVRNPGYYYYREAPFHFHSFDWFGFSLSKNSYRQREYLDRLTQLGVTTNDPSEVKMSNSKAVKKGFVSGRIVDENGEPLPAVNVVVKGTTRGTVSDENGYYLIEVKRGEVLVFSFVGYSTAEATITRKNTANVVMNQEVTHLSEIVVAAGTTTLRRQSLAFSVSTVVADTTAADVEFAPLQGKVPGVVITNKSGGAARLTIRGAASLSGSETPLYVVDGVVVGTLKLDEEDLATIQVLKGSAATALYGAKAANGVIIITTRSGQKKLDEEMAKVNARKNFNETAFFFPHLNTDPEGKIRFTFTTPESLTRWKLQLLAHRKDLVNTTKTLYSVTQKELMVTPNPPRFVREGDEIILSARITNLTGKSKDGRISLQLNDAITGESVDEIFSNQARNLTFKVEGKGTTEESWKLRIPSGIDAVQYRIVAKAGNHSDGEQNVLPVLSNRMLVTETLPMYVRSGQNKTFRLDKLKNQTSSTLKHHQLTLEVTSNPVWYALQSLPYLMEFPHECAEQTFARYYANALGSHIVNSTPKIREVFNNWVSSNAMISNLEKNPELKSMLIQETPWVRDAQDENEQKKRMALLFDLATLEAGQSAIIDKLDELQFSNGGFPWFAGSDHPNVFVTQHIASAYGHLHHLNVNVTDATAMMDRAIGYLDGEFTASYSELLRTAENIQAKAKNFEEGKRRAKEYLDNRKPNYSEVQYLYTRSFYSHLNMNKNTAAAVAYYRAQTAKFWTDYNIYMKSMIGLVLLRGGDNGVAKAIAKSLRETSIVSEELGMYWKENRGGWYWYEAPVEAHALAIELFSEADASYLGLTETEKRNTIDELRVWLLKNKQTSQWRTTKATTEAIYALLLNGSDWSSATDVIDVTVGKEPVTPPAASVEAGTGYFKKSWSAETITADMADVTLGKKQEGIAWAGMYWQYFEQLDKITPGETPLKLKKGLFKVSRDHRGEILTPVDQSDLNVGDLLRVRIELTVDREMEFLHMKDMRAAGFEPVDVLSEYKWQEGLGYYQSTKDASTNFFFDRAPVGVYVFEYDLRANNRGDFSNGITTIQSMYAPEFSSHTEGARVKVD